MKLTINDNCKLFSIQEEFNQEFPFLKIDFYAKSNRHGGPATEKIVEKSSKTINDCRTTHENGTITISPNMTVSELESLFNNKYGLKINISRKSGKSWLETNITNIWTLQKQNDEGKILSEETN
jgi:hypothetical protein